MKRITFGHQRLDLHPARAVIWPAQHAVIIADPHFGKGAAFRNSGVPVPTGVTEADVDRLSRVIAGANASRLIVLGDFLHARGSRANSTFAALRDWRRRSGDLEITLVRGNHDRTAGDPPLDLGIRCVQEPFFEGGFALCHDPACAPPDAWTLAGHVHPSVVVRSAVGSALRCECLWIAGRVAVLPSFGGFTGCGRVAPGRHDRVYLFGDEDVIEASRI